MRYSRLSYLAIALAAGMGMAQDSPRVHGYMHPDPVTLRQWQEEYRRMPRATFRPVDASGKALASAELPAKADVLSYLTYVPSERHQGACGDCWVWGSTAMVEVALAAQYNLKDRLSVQFLNSARTSDFACNGGTLDKFATWYNTKKILVPWSNPNAAFRDAGVNDYCTKSLVDPATIGRTPSYAFTSITASLIDPMGKTQDQMIESIKTALAGRKAVGFSYYTDFNSADGFGAFWDEQDESALWVNAYEANKTWNDKWGGHMVTVVGYNAEDADPAKHYWIVLNSWGGPVNRPNGFFRMPMRVNYGATYTYTDGSIYNCYLFNILDLDATPAAPAAPTAQIALSDAAPAVMQPLTLTAQVTGTAPLSYQWRKNGTPIGGATSAQLELPCLSPSDAGQAYDVIVTNSAGTKTSDPVTFAVTGQNLLLNPGMEEDQSGWTATSSLGLSPWRIGSQYASLAHSGSGYSYLAGGKSDGSIDTECTFTQKVQVPNQPGSLTLSYWMRSSTAEDPDTAVTAKDTLAVSVLDESGAELEALKTHSNLDVDHLLWKQESFDLAAYKGRTIQIRAKSLQDAQNYSAFRLDDFGLVLVSPQVGLTLSPAAATLVHGGTQTFTPALTTGAAGTVTWASAQGGMVPAAATATGAPQIYTAPATGTTDTITVTAVDSPTATATAVVTLVAPEAVTVSVSPAAVEMMAGSGTQQFTSTVAPLTNTAVIWSGMGVSASGLFSAAGLPSGSYTVTVASQAAPSRTATATVTLVEPSAVHVAVTPGTSTLLLGGTLQFSATVAGLSLDANKTVTWSTSGGTVSPSGLFTASAAGSFTVTATNAFSGAVGTATVNVKTRDLNSDTSVDLLDLLIFARHYGTANAACDLNGDGTVNDTDLDLLIAGL